MLRATACGTRTAPPLFWWIPSKQSRPCTPTRGTAVPNHHMRRLSGADRYARPRLARHRPPRTDARRVLEDRRKRLVFDRAPNGSAQQVLEPHAIRERLRRNDAVASHDLIGCSWREE